MNTILLLAVRSRVLWLVILPFLLTHTGCSPTYPKEIVDKAIIQLCREEYNIDVKVKIVGNTVGVYLPIEGLFDMTLNISKEAADKINDVLLSVSRVTLSTDAPLDFYIVIAQDPLLPDIEVVLIRYIKDIKLLHFDQISRGEFGKRMIIDIKLTPQAKKEKVLRDVLTRLNIKDQDKLIEEYLATSEATSIGDIGYWNGRFFIKDINMGEFLAMQIADRIKAEFSNRLEFRRNFKLNTIKGEFLFENGRMFFRFSFDITPLVSLPDFAIDTKTEKMYEVILNTIANVLHSYKYKEFWNVEIVNIQKNQVLFATSEELEEYRNKRMRLEDFRRWYR